MVTHSNVTFRASGMHWGKIGILRLNIAKVTFGTPIEPSSLLVSLKLSNFELVPKNGKMFFWLDKNIN